MKFNVQKVCFDTDIEIEVSLSYTEKICIEVNRVLECDSHNSRNIQL